MMNYKSCDKKLTTDQAGNNSNGHVSVGDIKSLQTHTKMSP